MGMRCKRQHPYQAGGGVCATCLRDRLVTLAAEQNDASSPPPPPQQQQRQRPEPPAAAPAVQAAFPRSVSPYVSRRKSDTSGGGAALRHHPSLLFFRTPQVGPSYGSGGALEEGDIGYEKRRAGKFSVLSTLFGHHHHQRSEEERDNGGVKERKNRSWLSGIMPRRRKKQAPSDAASLPPRRSCRAVSNRGLSPERDCLSGEESSSPADPPWQPSPSSTRRTPIRRRQTNSLPSGFAVCLSPLVRPSPGRRHRAGQPLDPGTFSSELRPSPLHNLAPAASITRCRSKKLADGGRFRCMHIEFNAGVMSERDQSRGEDGACGSVPQRLKEDERRSINSIPFGQTFHMEAGSIFMGDGLPAQFIALLLVHQTILNDPNLFVHTGFMSISVHSIFAQCSQSHGGKHSSFEF